MTNYMDVTTNAAVIPTMVAAQTLGRLASNMGMLGAVNRDYENEVAAQGDTVDVGVRGALTANNKTAGADVTIQDPTTTAVSVVLNKHKEVTFGEEDIARMFSRPALMEGYADDAAIALLEAIEADLAALYTGLSQTIDATSGLNEDDFREAQRLLNAAKAPQSNRVAILHEDAFKEAMNIERIVNRDYQGDAAIGAIQRGTELPFLDGFFIIMDQNIAVATAQAKNLFIHRDALALVTRPMRVTDRPNVEQAVMMENGIGLRVTLSYNANALAEQMTIDVIYGVAELRDALGVVVSTTEV